MVSVLSVGHVSSIVPIGNISPAYLRNVLIPTFASTRRLNLMRKRANQESEIGVHK